MKETLFLFRYVFQAALHTLWRERTSRRHGEPAQSPMQIIRCLDKLVETESHHSKGEVGNVLTKQW